MTGVFIFYVYFVFQEHFVKVYNKERVTDYPHLNLICARYTDRAGKDKAWMYASRQNPGRPDAVVVVPFHKQLNRLVLIKEFRVPLEGFQYGFPAGLVDPDESVEQAGERELFEETGLTVVNIIKKSPPVFSSSGMTDESVSLLYVECDGRPDTGHNEASELIEVKMMTRQEAAASINSEGLLFDVKTWVVLDRFAATGQVT